MLLCLVGKAQAINFTEVDKLLTANQKKIGRQSCSAVIKMVK
jgi:hypothetical protein